MLSQHKTGQRFFSLIVKSNISYVYSILQVQIRRHMVNVAFELCRPTAKQPLVYIFQNSDVQ